MTLQTAGNRFHFRQTPLPISSKPVILRKKCSSPEKRVSNLDAVGNVELPLVYRGVSKNERKQLAMEALKSVGLEDRMKHKPNEMSGGQQQRVAVARAVAAKPPIILADEPTGNLDTKSTQEIMEILKELHRSGRTVIIITHDEEIASQAHRVIRILDGRIEEDYCNR